MRVLFLFSNWKLTGPAEPALDLALALRVRGLEVSFACGRRPPAVRPGGYLADCARRHGLEPIEELRLAKHLRLLANLRDVCRARRLIAQRDIQLVHVHQRNDHLIGGWAARNRCPVVRTCYDGETAVAGRRDRFLYRRLTDAVVCLGRRARDDLVGRHGFPADRLLQTEGAIDLERFNPDRPLADDVNPVPGLGLQPDAFVVGVVARVQPQRRFEVLLEAARRAHERVPELVLLIIGRGSHRHELVDGPVAARGWDFVKPLGFHPGDAYLWLLKTLDVLVYLVPGSDGSCRAARQGLAMGVPVIAARRGMLPEIVRDGEDGLVIDDSVDNLAAALLELKNQPELRRTMGSNARRNATRFGLRNQAARVEELYRSLLLGDRS